MTTITNTQRTFTIDHAVLTKQAERMLAVLDYSDFDLGILICRNDA